MKLEIKARKYAHCQLRMTLSWHNANLNAVLYLQFAVIVSIESDLKL